jgi:tetratricopeptide (TPR) repeat protein
MLLVGLLAKEVALAAAAAILLSDVMQGGLRAIRARRALPLGWAIATYVALRWWALHGVASIEVARAPQPWLTLAAIGDYARIFFRMHPANVIGRPIDVSAAGVVTGVIVVGLVGGAGVALALRSDRARACALAFGVCALAPVVHVIRFPSHTLVADRYLYVPTAAIAALAALGWSRLGGQGRKALAALVVPLGIWMGLVTWARVDDWRDEVRFWAVTARDAPADDAMPVTNLAVSLARAQRCDLAVDLVRPIVTTGPYAASPPDVAIAEQNLVACLSETGAHDEAIAFARDALERSPARPSALRTLGVTAMSAQRFGLARGALQRWAKVDPSSADARAWLDLAREADVAFSSQEVQTGGSVARAVWLQRIGADHEAEQAWRALLASAALTTETVRAAAGYLVERGSVEAARAAVDRVDPSSGDAAALRDALADRVRVERQIDASTALISELTRRASR